MTEEAKHDPVPIERFGLDHWSTLVYIETRVVDYDGQVDRRALRGATTAAAPPTRLCDGTKLENHTDLDCCEDMEKAGLLVNVGTGFQPKFKLTDLGWRAAAAIRRWRGERKPTKDFRHTDIVPTAEQIKQGASDVV